MGAADRLLNWARNPWAVVGAIIGLLLVVAWIGWAIHVWSDHGARQGLGVLIVWPAILAALVLLSIPLVWAFLVIRASERSGAHEPEAKPERTEADAS